MEQLKKITEQIWDIRMLDNIEGIKKENKKNIISDYLNKVNHENMGKQTIKYIIPVVFSVARRVVDVLYLDDINYLPEDLEYLENIDETILDKVDVTEIQNRLQEFVTMVLPISGKYLGHIDSEAELLALFSKNYLLSII